MVTKIPTYIFQPNCFTEANYNATLIQEKLINAVIYRLQEAINKRMHGENYIQLSLFGQNNNSFITIEIPLSEIARPPQYKFVKDSVKKLASIVVELKYRDEIRKENRIRITGLFRVDIPEKGKRNSKIFIEMDKKVAKKLIEIDLNEQGKPINYTKFIYQVALMSKTMYTTKIYKLLCGWRKKGQFIISLDDFRKNLGIEKKYKFYRDIKKNVLLPVQKDLESLESMGVADCIFDCNTNDFVIKDGNKVTTLVFRIITKEQREIEIRKKEQIINLLKNHFSFSVKDFNEIDNIFINSKMPDILNKIMEIHSYISKNQENIDHNKSYLKSSLINAFLRS
jgi:uncharacterized ParB-like nuclease family protein